MKICPNCSNEHNGPWSRCSYCYAVTQEHSKRRQDSGTAGTDDAVAEHRHDQAEQTDGGWIE